MGILDYQRQVDPQTCEMAKVSVLAVAGTIPGFLVGGVALASVGGPAGIILWVILGGAPGIGAIIFGVMALKEIRASAGTLCGRLVAWTGILLGSICTGFLIWSLIRTTV